MKDNTRAKIFLSGDRRKIETPIFRSFKMLEVDDHLRQQFPFEDLIEVSDETIAAGKSTLQEIKEEICIVLLPIVGSVIVKLHNVETVLSSGEIKIIQASENTQMEIFNPLSEGLVNYLQVRIKKSRVVKLPEGQFEFNIDKNKNRLTELFNTGDISGEKNVKAAIGKFSGREAFIYPFAGLQQGAFIFLVQGAFEVQDRLMEARDGLALWNTGSIECESLSGEAIIFILEMPIRYL